MEIGPKRLETITSCNNQWISTTREPERTLSNHTKQAGIQIGPKVYDAVCEKSLTLEN